MKDRITSSNEVQADAISVKNLDKGEFLIKSSHLTDTAYRLHFGSNEAMSHCDCPDWVQTLLPCKHFVAVMREFKEWTWAKFPEEYKSSPYLTLDRTVLFNSSEMGEHEPNTSDESQSANQISHFFDLPEVKSTFRSKAASCRELLKEIKSLTYTTYDEEAMSDLYDTLNEAYSKLKLAAIDDNGLLLENSTDIQVIRKEKLRATTSENSCKSIKTLNIPLRKGKRSAYTGRIGAHADIMRKSARLDIQNKVKPEPSNNVVEEPVLEDVIYEEMFDIPYHSSLVNLKKEEEEQKGVGRECPKNWGNSTMSQSTETINNDENNKVDNVTETSEDESENDKNNNVSVTGTVPLHFVHREDVQRNLILSDQEERIIMKNEMLTDESINLAQNHLHEAFPSNSGLQDTAIGATQTFNVVSGNFIQILHDGNLHWVCTSNISFDSPTDVSDINVYDSYNHGYITKMTKRQMATFMFVELPEMNTYIKSVQQQPNGVDCGVFAIAFAAALAFGDDPKERDSMSRRCAVIYVIA